MTRERRKPNEKDLGIEKAPDYSIQEAEISRMAAEDAEELMSGRYIEDGVVTPAGHVASDELVDEKAIKALTLFQDIGEKELLKLFELYHTKFKERYRQGYP
jgi:hypothetical protein